MPSPRKFIAIVYTAYGDDSADETKQRVFAVAALFGSEEDWKDIYGKWEKHTGGKIFHAADCDSNQGDFKDNTNAENKALYGDLSKLLGESKLIGAGAAISIPDYVELLSERVADTPYYLCFYSVIGALAQDSAVCIPQDSVKFIFDSNHEIDYNAGALYQHFMRNNEGPENEYKKYMEDELGFATRKRVGIQVADLLARETMKHMDNHFGPVQRPSRLAYQALRKNKGIRIRLYGRAWCENLIRFSLETGGTHTMSEYYEWLNARGLSGDTVARRVRFQTERQGLIDEN